MSRRRGRRRCLPSGFPGSCRLFTILEDPATPAMAMLGQLSSRCSRDSLLRLDEHGRAGLRVAADDAPIRSRGFCRFVARARDHVVAAVFLNLAGDLRTRLSLFTSSVARCRVTRFRRIPAHSSRKQLQFAIEILPRT
jgi:hypothetical protein